MEGNYMENFERVAKKTAYYVSVFMEKYAGLLENMLKSNGHGGKELEITFDEIKNSFQGNFRKVLAQKLAKRYQEAAVNNKTELNCFDVINGGAFGNEHKEDNLSLIEECLDECGYDKSILNLRLLSGVRISVNLKYFMNDAELRIENLGNETYDSTWYEKVYPTEIIEFGITPDQARFQDGGAYRPTEDIMEEGLNVAKRFHNSYAESLKERLESLEKAIEEKSKEISRIMSSINEHRKDAKIVPSELYEDEEFAESCIERYRENAKQLESHLKAIEESSNIEYEGGKYAYAYASQLGHTPSEPGEEN